MALLETCVPPFFLGDCSLKTDGSGVLDNFGWFWGSSVFSPPQLHPMFAPGGEGGPLQDVLGQAIVSLAMDDNTRAQAGKLFRLRVRN